uniref:Uncharacterized protein n=1 Tax=Anguilla anguilla TaxID=7936 RepID=A0A0E9TCF8_ANGAN
MCTSPLLNWSCSVHFEPRELAGTSREWEAGSGERASQFSV